MLEKDLDSNKQAKKDFSDFRLQNSEIKQDNPTSSTNWGLLNKSVSYIR